MHLQKLAIEKQEYYFEEKVGTTKNEFTYSENLRPGFYDEGVLFIKCLSPVCSFKKNAYVLLSSYLEYRLE